MGIQSLNVHREAIFSSRAVSPDRRRAHPPARGSTLGRSSGGIEAMNADEAQKCLLDDELLDAEHLLMALLSKSGK